MDALRLSTTTKLADARGRAVKIVAQLLPHLPPEQACRVVFMDRDLDEVLASQQIMLDKLGRKHARLSDAQLKQVRIDQTRALEWSMEAVLTSRRCCRRWPMWI